MSALESNDFLLNLQTSILDVEENSSLLTSLPPKTLSELAKVGFDYECIALFLLDPNNRIQRSFFTYKTGPTVSPTLENGFDAPLMFTPGNIYSTLGANLLQGQPVLIPDHRVCTFPNSFNSGIITSLVVIPIKIANKVVGAVAFGIPRPSTEVSVGEMNKLTLITNMLAVAFRLQDTQVSLTRITQEVYKMNAQLHQLDKLKDDFVSIASHELRTPMTAIRSYVWMAINRSDIPLSEKLKKYLERTLISTERLINLVNDMLNISRIESGRVEIRPRAFNVNTLINDVIYEVDAKAKERGVTVTSNNAQVPNIFADADKVHQVLLNFVGNALKFTPSGGKIEIITYSDGNMIQVAVKDSGVGIGKDDIFKLFTKFGRLDSSYVAAATSGGTGLGLYICKNLIEMMNGKIGATSEGIGKGTTFYFILPVATQQLIDNAERFHINSVGDSKGLEPVTV